MAEASAAAAAVHREGTESPVRDGRKRPKSGVRKTLPKAQPTFKHNTNQADAPLPAVGKGVGNP